MTAVSVASVSVLLAGDGPPLDPTSPQARDWLSAELSKGMYHTQPSLFERFMDWLSRLLSPGSGSGPALPAWAVLVVVVALLALVALVVVRVLRREARTRPALGGAVLDEPGVSAAEYRRRAVGAATLGRWDDVVLDGYRAITQGVVERTILDDLPGRTADEVARDLAPVFPVHADGLRSAAVAFDAVRYGHLAAEEGPARAVLALEDGVRTTRPILPSLPDLLEAGSR